MERLIQLGCIGEGGGVRRGQAKIHYIWLSAAAGGRWCVCNQTTHWNTAASSNTTGDVLFKTFHGDFDIGIVANSRVKEISMSEIRTTNLRLKNRRIHPLHDAIH